MLSIRRLLGVLGAFLLSMSGQSQADVIAPEADDPLSSMLSPKAKMAGTSDTVPNVRSMPEIPLLTQWPAIADLSDADPNGDVAPHANAAPHSNGAPHSNAAPHANAAPHSNAAPHANAAPHSNAAPHANAAVPEPDTLALLALGLGGLKIARRRRGKD